MSGNDVQGNDAESSAAATGGASGHGFQKGRSGNPGGQPLWVKNIRESLKALSPKAVSRLEQIILTGEDKDANAAIKIALEFSVPKPTQKHKVSGQLDSNPLKGLTTEALAALAKGEGK